MVSPGPLSTGHSAVVARCFVCHTPWRGATSEQCIACHVLADIGIRTTSGTRIAPKSVNASFHKELLEQNYLACHSIHRRLRPALTGHQSFSHNLLRPAVQARCGDCHTAPVNKTHRDLKAQCGQCHQQEHWKPASFDHAVLGAQALTSCQTCHNKPDDKLHGQMALGCQQCHDAQAWLPARFDHDQYFKLDKQHNTACVTCHINDDYRRYTCYGCHEHSAARMRAEHQEESVRFSDDCIKCHKSADDDGDNNESGEGRERDD